MPDFKLGDARSALLGAGEVWNAAARARKSSYVFRL